MTRKDKKQKLKRIENSTEPLAMKLKSLETRAETLAKEVNKGNVDALKSLSIINQKIEVTRNRLSGAWGRMNILTGELPNLKPLNKRIFGYSQMP